nr:unnamed protein product [Digitaria exilis]
MGIKITQLMGFRIDGEPRLGSTLTACGYPTNGTALCYFQWVHLENGIRQYIEGALKPDYVVTADDVGTLLAIDCTPFDDNGRHVSSQKLRIIEYLSSFFSSSSSELNSTYEPEMQSHIDACILNGRAEFEVFLLHSPEEWELATLVLTRPSCQIKLKHTGEVIVDEQLRDLIVLVIRSFQKKAIDAKRKGKAV